MQETDDPLSVLAGYGATTDIGWIPAMPNKSLLNQIKLSLPVARIFVGVWHGLSDRQRT